MSQSTKDGREANNQCREGGTIKWIEYFYYLNFKDKENENMKSIGLHKIPDEFLEKRGENVIKIG